MSIKYLSVLIVAVVFGILRFVLPVGGLNSADIFKDLAHCFVGGLFGAAIVSKQPRFWALAIGLTILEVVAAIVRG